MIFNQVSPRDVILENKRANTPASEQLVKYLSAVDSAPSDLMCNAIVERLKKTDCSERGWVLNGFPRNLEEAEMLSSAGIIPNRYLIMTKSSVA